MRFGNAVVAGLIGFCAATPLAQATVVNLTFDGAIDTINGALFIENDIQATGSGVLDSFVRMKSNGDIEQGFNTSARPLQLDENNSPIFTHDMQLTDIPVIEDCRILGCIDYREFILDINQTGTEPLLSLDVLQIYMGNQLLDDGVPSNPALLGTLIYNMDAGTDSWVKLNYSLNHGSGSGDMRLLVPNSLFTGPGSYVYLYSKFGVQGGEWVNNDGYEEWATRGTGPGQCGEENTDPCPPPPGEIPEPTSMLLMGTGLIGAIGFASTRKRSKKA